MPKEVWKTLTSNLVETIHSMEWNEEYTEFIGPKMLIAEGWGLVRGTMDGL